MMLRLLAERLAARATRSLGIARSEASPLLHVAAYPKSGSTWLARMVADYFGLPFPQHRVLPITFPAVIQTFQPHHPRLRRVIYLYRDGRDVMVSLYFDRLRVARHSDAPGRALVARTYEGLLGPGYDPADIAAHLPRFIEFELTRPGRGSPLAWPDHVRDWDAARGRPDVAFLRYEDLLADPCAALGRALEKVGDSPVDRGRLAKAVERMSMRRLTGRDPGQSDPTDHIRKGVAGDWKNHFSREAAELFHRLAGRTLIALGYEPDARWVSTRPALRAGEA